MFRRTKSVTREHPTQAKGRVQSHDMVVGLNTKDGLNGPSVGYPEIELGLAMRPSYFLDRSCAAVDTFRRLKDHLPGLLQTNEEERCESAVSSLQAL